MASVLHTGLPVIFRRSNARPRVSATALRSKCVLRRRGVATALFTHCVADARARGAERVLIGASTGSYDIPRRFYAAAGFRPLCLTWSYFQIHGEASS